MSDGTADNPWVLLPETVDISGGAVITATADVDEEMGMERMVWLDAIARISSTEQMVHVRLFVPASAAVGLAVTLIQAAGRAEGKTT